MPNWVKNRITFTGKNAKAIINSLLSNDNLEPNRKMFDFNKIIPMPKSLEIESGSVTNTCIELYMTSINPTVDYYGKNKIEIDRFLKIKTALNSQRFYGEYNVQLSKSELKTVLINVSKLFNQADAEQIALEKGKVAIDNIEAYGYKDWYDWSIANWGTKWNACDTTIKGRIVEFDTAWSPVPDIIQKLSKMYPDLELDYKFAEEQIGYLTGHYTFKNGQVNGVQFENFSPQAYETSFELWGGREYYQFDEKTKNYNYIENGIEI